MKKLIGAAVAMALGASAPAIAGDVDAEQRVMESKKVIKAFMTELKGELKAAMKAGGPVNAIEVCNTKAPGIAKAQSEKHGWEVARTSLKYRNPSNAPDPWEEKVLKTFEERKADGENPKKMAYYEIIDQEDGSKAFRFMKAIPTGEICLKCHGENIAEPVKAKLDELYPGDKARGFNVGDIRGAFTITQPM